MKGEAVTQETPEGKVKGRILAYMAPPPGFVSKAPLHMRSALIVGEMGSGKTTFIEAKLGEAVRSLLGQGVDEYNICYVYGKEAGVQQLLEAAQSLDLDKCQYLYLFNDDAPAGKGGHGRRAMSRENVSESQAYIMIRHRLKSLGFNGFLFVAHASQVYHLVDITFRRMAVLKFFKTYPDEPADFRLLGPLVGSAGLLALHDLSMKLWTSNNPKITWEAVHRAVAVLKRHRSLVRAEPEARRALERLPQQARVEPEDAARDPETSANNICTNHDEEALFYIARRLLENARIQSRGENVSIEYNAGARIWLRKRILEEAGLL